MPCSRLARRPECSLGGHRMLLAHAMARFASCTCPCSAARLRQRAPHASESDSELRPAQAMSASAVARKGEHYVRAHSRPSVSAHTDACGLKAEYNAATRAFIRAASASCAEGTAHKFAAHAASQPVQVVSKKAHKPAAGAARHPTPQNGPERSSKAHLQIRY